MSIDAHFEQRILTKNKETMIFIETLSATALTNTKRKNEKVDVESEI